MAEDGIAHWILFTDLDGTRLDHHSDSWETARPALAQLARARIPVILNTSKTFAEVQQHHRALGLHTPFVVGNGAAIYLPKSGYVKPKASDEHGEFWCVALIDALPEALRRGSTIS